MKTAIYIEDGVVQLVITPESDFEISTLGMLREGDAKATIFQGSFYDCRGGWVRQSCYNTHMNGMTSNSEDRSLILRVPSKDEEVNNDNKGAE